MDQFVKGGNKYDLFRKLIHVCKFKNHIYYKNQ